MNLFEKLKISLKLLLNRIGPLLILLGILLILAESYSYLTLTTQMPKVVAAVIVNSISLGLALIFRNHLNFSKDSFGIKKFSPSYLIPAFVVVVSILILCFLSLWSLPLASLDKVKIIHEKFDFIKLLLFCVWIPLVEELLFRGFCTSWLKRFYSILPAAYISAFAFSFLHTLVGFQAFFSLEIGIALGPIFLGLICEILRFKFKSLWPGIFLHASCNGTVFIFSAIDPRWLVWLRWLYV